LKNPRPRGWWFDVAKKRDVLQLRTKNSRGEQRKGLGVEKNPHQNKKKTKVMGGGGRQERLHPREKNQES